MLALKLGMGNGDDDLRVIFLEENHTATATASEDSE
jgi:hypothetical protein